MIVCLVCGRRIGTNSYNPKPHECECCRGIPSQSASGRVVWSRHYEKSQVLYPRNPSVQMSQVPAESRSVGFAPDTIRARARQAPPSSAQPSPLGEAVHAEGLKQEIVAVKIEQFEGAVRRVDHLDLHSLGADGHNLTSASANRSRIVSRLATRKNCMRTGMRRVGVLGFFHAVYIAPLPLVVKAVGA